MTGFIKKQRTQGTDQRPQYDRTAVDKSAQRRHQKKWQEQNQHELAESEKLILVCPSKMEGAEQGDDAIGKRDRPRQRFVEKDIQHAPGGSGENKGNGTYHQQRFLQADVILVIWVGANSGY